MSIYRGDPSKIGRPNWEVLPVDTRRTTMGNPPTPGGGVDAGALLRSLLQAAADVASRSTAAGAGQGAGPPARREP